MTWAHRKTFGIQSLPMAIRESARLARRVGPAWYSWLCGGPAQPYLDAYDAWLRARALVSPETRRQLSKRWRDEDGDTKFVLVHAQWVAQIRYPRRRAA